MSLIVKPSFFINTSYLCLFMFIQTHLPNLISSKNVLLRRTNIKKLKNNKTKKQKKNNKVGVYVDISSLCN